MTENNKEFRNLETGRALDFKKKSLAEEKGLSQSLCAAFGQGDAWALGHAMDGVIWGRKTGGSLVFSCETVPEMGAALDETTLLDLRIFNAEKELRVWRKGQGLCACLAAETVGEWVSWAEPWMLLAGKRLEKNTAGGQVFSLVEGPAGQRQALPADWDGEGQGLRLWVRQYAKPRENGMLAPCETRLLGLNGPDNEPKPNKEVA